MTERNRTDRVPVQRSHGKPPGSIEWWEHEEAWRDYAKRFGDSQSAARIAERGGFGFGELIDHLGHEPTTWRSAL